MIHQLAASCFRFHSTKDSSNTSISRDQFIEWGTKFPKTSYFLRHFNLADSLNPSSFDPLQCPVNGQRFEASHRPKLIKHRERQRKHVQEKVKIPISSIEEAHAALIIQSEWRRFLSKPMFHQKHTLKAVHLDESVRLVQGYLKRQWVYLGLQNRAKLEKYGFNGAVLSFGSKKKRELQDKTKRRILARPNPIEMFKLKSIKLVEIAQSTRNSIAFDTEGRLYIWGEGIPCAIDQEPAEEDTKVESLFSRMQFDTPTQINLSSPIQVKQIACGVNHCVLLASSGRIASFGFNDHGQLGHADRKRFQVQTNQNFQHYYDVRCGKTIDYLDQPVFLAYFASDESPKIKQIVAGNYYVLALSCDGNVYSWGEASEGQLGLGELDPEDEEEQTIDYEVDCFEPLMSRSTYTYTGVPHRIPTFTDDVKISMIAAGGNHNVALTEGHVVYEWGAWGRRCGEEREPTFVPEAQLEIEKYHFRSIAVGEDHCLAEGGSLWINLVQHEIEMFYIAMARFAPTMERMLEFFQDKTFELRIIDIGVDDIDEDANPFAESKVGEPGSDKEKWKQTAGDRRTAKTSAIESMRLPKSIREQFQDSECTFQSILDLLFLDIRGKIILMDRGVPEGGYIQVIGPEGNVCADFSVTRSNSFECITKLGITSHLFVVPPDEPMLYMTAKNQIPNGIILVAFTEDDVKVDLAQVDPGKMVSLLIEAIAAKVAIAQRVGVLAVIIELKFHGVKPFEINFPDENKPAIPVMMIDQKEADEIRNICKAQEGGHQCSARVFKRVDTLTRRIKTAFGNGALAVLLQQNKQCTGMDGETPGAVEVYQNSELSSEFVGMISADDGDRLRQLLQPSKTNKMSVQIRFQHEEGGNTYAWGCADLGRLGLGEIETSSLYGEGYDPNTDQSYDYVQHPALIGSLCGKRIKSLSCGSEHSVAVTEAGHVYTWGNGLNGQLGHGNTDDYYFPTLITGIKSYKIVKATANEHTSMLLCQAMEDEAFARIQRERQLLRHLQKAKSA